MIRMRSLADSKAAIAYFRNSDGYYLVEGSDLRREVGGKAAKQLGLTEVDFTQFDHLLQGLDPEGKQLTAKLQANRLAGWDITASIPKAVTIALESGDKRIHDALWEAGRETMVDLEAHITTRMKGGRDGEQITGNMVWYGFEHPETRPNKQDNMPDPDRHIHFVIPNVTYSEEAQQWQSIRFRPIMEDRKWFDRRFDSRLASKLADLGYEIETKYKAGKYYSWDVKGIPESVITKFSRRSAEVEKLAAEMKVESPMGKDKLGATSRQYKRDDLTLEDYRRYWASRITPEEGKQIEETIKAALDSDHVVDATKLIQAAKYAIDHHFYRSSVVPVKELEITAMERSMGAALPDEILPELRKRGLLEKNGDATTREVLEQESCIIAFAREGKGKMRPMSSARSAADLDTATLSPEQQAVSGERLLASRLPSGSPNGATPRSDSAHLSTEQQAVSRATLQSSSPNLTILSPEQKAVCRHVWESTDAVILIRGAAGTGKTHTMKTAIAGIDRPVTVLAPSADASRGVLRREGFKDADTVAAFLGNQQAQQNAKVIWVDEAGLLPIKDLAKLTDIARQNGARLILQGDPRQHMSVARHGNMFHVLQEFAGLPVAELKDIRRQKGRYKDAVKAIDKGDILKAHDILNELGYIHQVPVFDHNRPLVDDYMAGLNAGKEMLVVAPTHAEKDEITEEIRKRLKAEAKLGEDERVFETLKPLGWTDAEKADPLRYDGTEVIQFHRNSGPFRAGERTTADRLLSAGYALRPGHFSVYAAGHTALAAGDSIRATGNGWDVVIKEGKRARGKFRIDNGFNGTVKGFTKEGDISLTNGKVVPKEFGQITHGYVTTSHASQGKTVDRVLIAMGHESRPAINAAQFYVSVSRAREKATIYTDMNPATIREAIQKQDARRSATELMEETSKRWMRGRVTALMRRIRDAHRRLREQVENAITLGKERCNEGLSR